MDNLTHTLVGVGLANAFLKRRVGPEAVPILAVASNITDIDAIVHLSGQSTAILMRRTFGHSILLAPLWAFGLAWIFRRRYPHLSWRTLIGLCLLGIGTHLFFDLVNSFGVMLAWPLGPWRPELAMIYIIDLALTGLLAAPLILCVSTKWRGRLETTSRLSVACTALYILICGANRMAAEVALERTVGIGPSHAFFYVFPEPWGPHRWRGVVRDGNLYRVYLLHSLTGQVEPKGIVQTRLGDAAVERARQTDLGLRLERFFKAPVWEVDERGVRVYDLRFRSILAPWRSPFTYWIPLPEKKAASRSGAGQAPSRVSSGPNQAPLANGSTG